MFIDKQANDTIKKFKEQKLDAYPCSTWDTPPESSFKSDFGYCTYSLNEQPGSAKAGSRDPACTRYCKHKAPTKVVMLVTSTLSRKGMSKTAEICKGIKENNTKKKEQFSEEDTYVTGTFSKIIQEMLTKDA